MSKGIKVNNGHVNEVATQIETAKSYFRHEIGRASCRERVYVLV